MSELNELKEMLRDHIKDSSEGQTEIKKAIARIEVHGEYTKEKLDSHESTLDKLKSAHNKQKGVLWLLGAIGLSGLAEYLRTHF